MDSSCRLNRAALIGLSVIVGVLTAGAGSARAAAQNPVPAAQTQSSPSAGPASSLGAPAEQAAASGPISINVVVSDKLGHPVPGLQEGDFTLLDNKQPQKLVGFRAVENKDSPVHVIVVVDMINTAFDVVAREREELGQFLKEDGGELANPTSIGVLPIAA